MSKPFKPLVVLDFDGVLHSYSTKWTNAWTIPDPPVPGTIGWIVDHYSKFQLAVLSARSKSLRGRWAMKSWLRSHIRVELDDRVDQWVNQQRHFTAEEAMAAADPDPENTSQWADRILREIKFPWFKPGAWLSIDDRAWCFKGGFPTADEIKSFKPWNKQ